MLTTHVAIKQFFIDFLKAAVVLFMVSAVAVAWLYWKLEQATLAVYKGFNEAEINDVLDSRRMVRFYGSKYGSAAPPSDYIKSKDISKVCLNAPYGLPAERLSLNGLVEPNDNLTYLSFFVADGEHYYAVPLGYDFHIPKPGCRDPGSIIVSYRCTARQAVRYCLEWKDGE